MSDTQSVLRDLHRMIEARQFSDALAHAQSCMKKFPWSRAIAIELAGLLYICKLYDQALGLYSKLNKAKQDANEKTELPVLAGIADCQVKKVEYKKATELLEKLQQVAPNDPRVLVPLATCRRHAKLLDEAETFVNKALSKRGDDQSISSSSSEVTGLRIPTDFLGFRASASIGSG